MSSNELLALFPSALHPALPFASQILSTLRTMTAPGKGNNLKAEERAALVGVAALLGCEKVQSKDLIESSAQRASSVSPAHFRSALQHSRRILASVSIGPLEAGSSRRVSTRRSASSSSPAKSTSRQDAEEGDAGAGEDVSGTGSNVPSPYSTPRKKFKYSSGVDISGLVKTTPGRRQGLGTPSKSFHEPSIASPLRHSVTPATRNRTKEGEATSAVAEQGDGDAEAGSEVGTPSKKVKYAVQPGVDLEAVSNDVRPPAGLSSTPRRGNEDTSSFFAFRPGSGAQPSSSRPRRVRGVDVDERGSRVPIPLEDGLPNVRQTRHSLLKSAKQGAVVKKKRTRRDWRYPEVVWAGKAVQEENARVIKQAMTEMADWFQEKGLVSEPVDSMSLEDILLEHDRYDAMDLGSS